MANNNLFRFLLSQIKGKCMIDKISSSVLNSVSNNNSSPKQPEVQVHNNSEINNDPFKNTAFYGKDLVQTQQKANTDRNLNVVFKKLEGLEGDNFAKTAYKEMVKYMGLEDCAPKELTFEAQEGRPIASDYRWYENKVIVYRNYFDKATKAEKLGYIAHELTHCKQTTNILKTDAPNIVQQYAFAIAASDFRAAMVTNPQMRQNFVKAQQMGKANEYAQAMIYRQAGATYKELTTIFADILKQPKHPLNSQNGQKAIRDIQAQSIYNGADAHGWATCPLEAEAMAFENAVVKAYINK